MKKFFVFACLFVLGLATTSAQGTRSFFNDLGIAQLTTEEFSPERDTIVKVYHRQDDIIWSRIVYRIIDMRYKQNYQLYFPVRSDDPRYKSLFRVIVDGVVDKMPIYEKNAEFIAPEIREETRLQSSMIPTMFMIDDPTEDHSDDPSYYDIEESSAMLVHYDSVADQFSFNNYSYDSFIRNQTKYLIQEIVFFDKHTSRLHTKIMAIAPLHADKITTRDNSNIMGSLRESILFWIPFDALRPYMAMQYTIPSQNETKRVTFDEYFQKQLYTSYIVGDGNVYNRYITDYAVDEAEVKREQARIENELLNFEQDLWEY